MSDLKRVLTVDRTAPVRVMPCALCGEGLPHSRVLPADEGRLAFRATVLPTGEVWLPVNHPHVHCPDPPPSTKSRWSDDTWRERYKQAHREAAIARRTP